jgi:flagellar protein FlaG
MSDLSVILSATGVVGLEQEKQLPEALRKEVTVNQVTQAEAVKKEVEEKKEINEPSHEEVEVALTEVNAFVQSMQRNLSFTIDEQLGQEIILVTDTETQEVIRQIPSEELVVLRKKMDDVVGILFDTKV